MNTFKKSGIALVMALVFVLSPMKAFAAELPTEAVYDLEKGGTQHFVIQDENGEIAEVVIEELAGNSRVANGDYLVAYKHTGSWQAGFYVTIANNKFTDVYSPHYSVATGSITHPVLVLNSTTKATLSFIYRHLVLTYNTGVVAQISGTQLVVTKK